MVVVPADHTLHAFQEARGPRLIAADTVIICVCLDICLIHDIQAVDVAQFIPALIVGVMAGTHCIEIVLLHQADILDHTLGGKGLCHELVVLMTVYPLDQDTLAVDQKSPALDLYLAKSKSDAVMQMLIFQ